MKKTLALTLMLLAAACACTAREILVSSTADSGTGTLRWALQTACAGDVITFDPTIFPPDDPATIHVRSELPFIRQGNLLIDAGDAGLILDGSNCSSGCMVGLEVQSDNNRIQGLQILSFPQAGIVLSGGAKHNVIGGDRRIGAGPIGQGNVLSDNSACGVGIWDDGTSYNTITGNLIGTDSMGLNPLGNQEAGIRILRGGHDNTIGPGNVVTGNGSGIEITGRDSTANTVIGNLVGVSLGDLQARGNIDGVLITDGASGNTIGPANLIAHNEESGILIIGESTLGNTITQNCLYGNGWADIRYENEGDNVPGSPEITGFDLSTGVVEGVAPPGCVIEIFSVGTDGKTAYEGTATSDNSGGFVFEAGRSLPGPRLAATATDPTGTSSPCSAAVGVHQRIVVSSADDAGQGTLRWAIETAAPRDVIVFDPMVFSSDRPKEIVLATPLPPLAQGELTIDASDAGVVLDGQMVQEDWSAILDIPSSGNRIMGLRIVNSPGAGISICCGARDNVMGGDPDVGEGPYGEGNYVNNYNGDGPGVLICGEGTSHNSVMGNIIGALDERDAARGNGTGVFVSDGAAYNTIGPKNVIAYNREEGIQIYNPTSLGNTITRNSIFKNGCCNILLNDGGNAVLPAPTVDRYDCATRILTGTACPGCVVELFSGDKAEGEIYEGMAIADSTGSFTFSNGDSFLLSRLAATATNAAGDTSAFSAPIAVEVIDDAIECDGEALVVSSRIVTSIGRVAVRVRRTTEDSTAFDTYWYTLTNVDVPAIGSFALSRSGLDAVQLWTSPDWVANTEDDLWIWDGPPHGVLLPGDRTDGSVTVRQDTVVGSVVAHVWIPEEFGGGYTSLRLPGPVIQPPPIAVEVIDYTVECSGEVLFGGTETIVTPIGSLLVEVCRTTEDSTGLATYWYTLTNIDVPAIETFALSRSGLDAVCLGASPDWAANTEVSWWIWTGPPLYVDGDDGTVSFSVTVAPGTGSDSVIVYIWIPDEISEKQRHARFELPGPVP